jgi:hypothetical protein
MKRGRRCLARQGSFGAVALIATAGSIALGIDMSQVTAYAPQRPHIFEVVSVKPYKPLGPARGGDLREPAFFAGGRFTSKAR